MINDVAQDSGLSRPTIAWRFQDVGLRRAEDRDWTTAPGDRDALSSVLDLSQASQALGLELRCTQDSLHHDFHDSR